MVAQIKDGHGQVRIIHGDWAQKFEPLHTQNNIGTTKRQVKEV